MLQGSTLSRLTKKYLCCRFSYFPIAHFVRHDEVPLIVEFVWYSTD